MLILSFQQALAFKLRQLQNVTSQETGIIRLEQSSEMSTEVTSGPKTSSNREFMGPFIGVLGGMCACICFIIGIIICLNRTNRDMVAIQPSNEIKDASNQLASGLANDVGTTNIENGTQNAGPISER